MWGALPGFSWNISLQYCLSSIIFPTQVWLQEAELAVHSRVWDNNFMASAKSALYVNPVGRYEQPRVTKLCAVQQPMQDSVRQNWQKGTSLEN